MHRGQIAAVSAAPSRALSPSHGDYWRRTALKNAARDFPRRPATQHDDSPPACDRCLAAKPPAHPPVCFTLDMLDSPLLRKLGGLERAQALFAEALPAEGFTQRELSAFCAQHGLTRFERERLGWSVLRPSERLHMELGGSCAFEPV